ncbi:MAG TPA: cupin-like domain-containing protein [Bacteroidia bacterium]|jgi:hypothetical protein|nr:cupin-like domain-containing protein [Bacteroidia bacterium]
MDLSQKIEVVDYQDSSFNFEKYLRTKTPVIIRGLLRQTPAENKWSIPYFKKTMGDLILDVYDNGNKKAAASAYTQPDLKMKFRDYLQIIEKNEHTDLRIFLCNLFKYNPELRKDFPCPPIFKGLLDRKGFMFFGGKDTTVRIHYDIDMSNVLHTHFGGRKRVLLFAPEYSKQMYRLPFNTYSLANFDKPDYDQFPALRYVKGYEFILEHGDTLFMPSGYWHYMTYLEGSFSVSYRKLSPHLKDKIEGLMNLAFYLPMDKLLNKLLGSKWLNYKKELARKRAENTIREEVGEPAVIRNESALVEEALEA